MTRVTFDYRPIPVFVPFHVATDRDRCLFGGYGSGKSVAGCAEVQKLGFEQPGSEWMVTRKTVPALKDTTEKTFVQLLPPEFFKQCHVKRAGGHLDSIQFPNGTRYLFRSMDDWKKHRSLNLTGIFWDEADEFTPEDFEGMNSRLRQVEPLPEAKAQGASRIHWRGNILACNPQGRNWLWEKFVGPNRKDGTAYWTSSSLDNPFLPRDYIEHLLSYPDPWVRRYVLCNFDEFAGAIFDEFSYERHWQECGPDPAKWLRDNAAGGYLLQGFDPGTAAANAATWWYYHPQTHMHYVSAEYLEKGLAATIHADAWRRIEARLGFTVNERYADPKAITVRDRGVNITLMRQYQDLGFYFREGVNDINDRLSAMGNLIHLDRLKVLSCCPQTFEQIKNYRYEDLTPSMVERGKVPKPLKKDVDLVDACEYLAARWQSVPRVVAAAKPDTRSPQQRLSDEIWDQIRVQSHKRRSATRSHDLGSIAV